MSEQMNARAHDSTIELNFYQTIFSTQQFLESCLQSYELVSFENSLKMEDHFLVSLNLFT